MDTFGDRRTWWFVKGDASSWENNSYKDSAYMVGGDRVLVMMGSRNLEPGSHMYNGLACTGNGGKNVWG